ncbi:hypothetical protein EIN_054840 [Entamoeba invadens IP1]|uniref:hypothetical protein n=1 Tax=Entamoeba invadens IP1 TaxID=370355 RepID=UPI0002C3F269|nr:hypothetical protein EIN_054840 [Entamoeba invadens IP1]ELP93189.1 hypothetical protein EIN_054840 [Entamoeba invadens IP1]|eukprot:XP_004259960.1 hypothetical protein EIN_054840 [Entamoeba invadens IP1]
MSQGKHTSFDFLEDNSQILTTHIRKPVRPQSQIQNSSLKQLSTDILSEIRMKNAKHNRVRRKTLALDADTPEPKKDQNAKKKKVFKQKSEISECEICSPRTLKKTKKDDKKENTESLISSQTEPQSHNESEPSSENKEITKEEVINTLTTELDTLQNEVKIAREKSGKMLDSQQQWKALSDMITTQRKLSQDMRENLKNLTIRDTGSRAEVEESAEFMGNMFSKSFDDFSEQLRSAEELFLSVKEFTERSNNYKMIRNEFDKMVNAYTTTDTKLQKMNKDKRPDVNKIGVLQQQKDDLFSSIESEGGKAIDLYVDLYNMFLSTVLHSSVEYGDKVQRETGAWKRMFKDKGEKLNVWKSLNIGEAVKNNIDDFPLWMDDYPVFANIFKSEKMIVENLGLCISKYAKPILCSPTLATSGLSIKDVDLIFSDIETMHVLHTTLLNKLNTANAETFIDVFYLHLGEFYQVFMRRCAIYKDSMNCLNTSMKIKTFHEVVEAIGNANPLLPKLEDLINLPFIQLLQLKQCFSDILKHFPEHLEKTEKILFVMGMLTTATDQAEKENDVQLQLSKISDLLEQAVLFSPRRRYLDRQQCVLNKTQGTLFIFSDLLIFTRLERNQYYFEEAFGLDSVETFKLKNRRVVSIITSEYETEFTFKESLSADKFVKHLTTITFYASQTKVFGAELGKSTMARDEESFLLPQFVHAMFDRLFIDAPKTEGIFRVSASVREIEDIIRKVDRGESLDVKKCTTHLVGNLLKKFINSVPNKLPQSLQTHDPKDISGITSIVDSFDLNTMCLMDKLFGLMSEISKKSDVNKMNPENLSKVMSPNVYPSIDFVGLDVEKMTRTVIVMISNYDVIFKNAHLKVEKKLSEAKKEADHLRDVQKEMNSQTGFNAVPVSKLVEGTIDDKSVVLTLKDIIKQGDADILEGKKWNRRWVVLKKNCLMIFKSAGEGQTMVVIQLKGAQIGIDTKTERECVVIKKEKQSMTILFENQKEWIEALVM